MSATARTDSNRYLCTDTTDDYVGSCGHDHSLYKNQHFAAGSRLELPGNFPSARVTIGEPGDATEQAWRQRLGDIPKDCYYCSTTGKCALDTPEAGSGKDYMGEKCNACSGSGVCQHCSGDGIIGRPYAGPLYGTA